MSEYIYFSHGEPLANEDGIISLAREEIVRCRDCAYSFDAGSRCRKWRGQDCFENSVPEHVNPEGYCAWGERREQHG